MQVRREKPKEVTYSITMDEEEIKTLVVELSNLSRKYDRKASAPDSGVRTIHGLIHDMLLIAP